VRFPDAPPRAQCHCETAGVLAAAPTIVASIQFAEAVKIIVGDRENINPGLIYLDVWSHDYKRLDKIARRTIALAVAGGNTITWSKGHQPLHVTVWTLRRASSASEPTPDQPREVSERLKVAGLVTANDYLVRLVVEPFELTISPTDEPS